LLEKKAKDLTVTDENGLDRFKNGIFVDPMTSFSLCDISNPEFSIAIDSSKGVARPKIVRETITINFSSTASSNVVKTGRLITLNYTEVPFLVQQYATKYRSSALVAYAWNGHLTLIPTYDNGVNEGKTGSAEIYIDSAAPWKEFASSPFGVTWGDWRTTTSTEVETILTGEVRNKVYDFRGNLVSDRPAAVQPVANPPSVNDLLVQAGWNGGVDLLTTLLRGL
jgi:hypothetical protein